MSDIVTDPQPHLAERVSAAPDYREHPGKHRTIEPSNAQIVGSRIQTPLQPCVRTRLRHVTGSARHREHMAKGPVTGRQNNKSFLFTSNT